MLASNVRTARINETEVEVGPRETLLQAALRAGIPFPNSCRVGGCGSCKCRLVEGEVDELTETGYLLSADEIDGGTILACQSRPRSAVRVEVDLDRRGIAGQVVAQRRATHDITHLTVQLDRPLDYRPGQFARLTFDGLDEARCYSFASPPTADGRLDFFVRHVPGGCVSGHVHREALVGQGVSVDGPDGDFWLRPDDTAPLLFVAGGSGLAPILAMLEAAADAGVRRPATLLFGARARRDLYAMDAIEAIAARWGAPFVFVPVLSDAIDDAAWSGARGWVTDHIDAHLADGSHAYLCGPPAMVDAAMAALDARGVAPEHVRCDRFTTRADTRADGPVAGSTGTAAHDPVDPRPPAGWLHYLKYCLFHGIGLTSAAMLLAGGHWITLGLLTVVAFYVIGDAISGDDTETPRFTRPGVLTGQLWLALPLLALIVFAAVWSASSVDVFGVGAWLGEVTGYDFLAAREATSWGHHLSGIVLTGLMIGMVGTIPGHELTHRTWDPISLAIGRWLLAFSFDTIFAIEHVYGHHRYVSTTHDPATAPRGRNVYAHVAISTVRGNISAWRIERARLAKRRMRVLSLRNAFIRGHLSSLLLVAVAGLVGGWVGAAYFVACGLVGKALLEIVNYMEHYGMVRDPETPVMPRHSWNTNRRISSWALFNLTRHSHHHAQGEVPYHALRPYPDAPLMINGYLTTLIVALVPPVWHRLMVPKLREWDRVFATPHEQRLAAEANARSGLRGLRDGVEAAPGSELRAA